jgi:diguanylate cyclase
MSKPPVTHSAAADSIAANDARPAPVNGISALMEQIAVPLRDEVAGGVASDPVDRSLRRSLDELLYDCGQGLTDHSAARAARDIDGAVADWFDRRREAEATRNREMTRVIADMGGALKALHGDDTEFFKHLDQNLSRLRGAADSTSARTASARLSRLIEGLGDGLAAQKTASEKRLRQLSGMVRGLHDELSAVKVRLAEDPLTGLYNRGTFDDHLQQALNKAAIAPYEFTLVMIDLDHFKAVNDEHGHVGGDRVLKAVAELLVRLVFRSNDLVARYGGEELAIILDDSGAERGAKVAQEICDELAKLRIELPGAVHRQTASFGVAAGADSDTPESLIQRADECLYLAKRNGRNQVVTAGWGALGRRVGVPRGLPCGPREG